MTIPSQLRHQTALAILQGLLASGKYTEVCKCENPECDGIVSPVLGEDDAGEVIPIAVIHAASIADDLIMHLAETDASEPELN